MSLEVLAAGALALKGISMLGNLLRGSDAAEAAESLQGDDSLTQAEFEELIAQLVEAAEKGTSGQGGADAETLTALLESEQSLAPLLFQALDADGSGMIEGDELKPLQSLISEVQRELPADVWTSLSPEVTSLSG